MRRKKLKRILKKKIIKGRKKLRKYNLSRGGIALT